MEWSWMGLLLAFIVTVGCCTVYNVHDRQLQSLDANTCMQAPCATGSRVYQYSHCECK